MRAVFINPAQGRLRAPWRIAAFFTFLVSGYIACLGAMGAGEASSWFDAKVIDGTVNGAGWSTRAVATLSTWWDKWIIDGVGVNGPAILARMISYPARLFEWGLVQWYALVMIAGLIGFVVYYVWK